MNAAKSYIESNSKHKHSVDVDSEEFQSIDEQVFKGDTPDRIIESQELQQVVVT